MLIKQVEIKKKKKDSISNLTLLKSLTQLNIYPKSYIALFEHLLYNEGGEQVLYLVASLMT